MMLGDSIRLSKSDGCPAGGRVMAFGLDNGDNGGTPGNGVLEFGEIDDQTTYCSAQRFSFCLRCSTRNNRRKTRVLSRYEIER